MGCRPLTPMSVMVAALALPVLGIAAVLAGATYIGAVVW